MRIFKLILKWILPQGFENQLKLIKEKYFPYKYKKDWNYQPLFLSTHDLPFFKTLKGNPFLVSLNRETRPAVKFVGSILLEFEIDKKDIDNYLQLGIGTRSNKTRINVIFHQKDNIVGKIDNLNKQSWTDIRIPINKKNICLSIKANKGIEIFFSHPIVVKKRRVTKYNNKNIICIILDGLNQSHLLPGLKSITPKINGFFLDGVFCTQAFSQSDWTLPTFSSMLSSAYPIKHGVYNPDENDSTLPDQYPTIPELLLKHGYRTFGYSSHSRFSPSYGHSIGFERFLYRQRNDFDYYTQIVTETVSHLEAHKNDNNFIFIHLFDTHAPYYPYSYLHNSSMNRNRNYQAYQLAKTNGFNDYLEYLTDLGQAKLKEVDLALDQLFSYCKKQDWYDSAYFILTADHGLPYRLKGMDLLSESRVNIPLCVRGPNIDKNINHSLIEGNVDLLPSILKLIKFDCPLEIDGKIWSFIGGEKKDKVLTESLYRNNYHLSIRTESHCYFYNAPFDHLKRKISKEKAEKIRIYQRINGKDIIDNTKTNIDQYQKNRIEDYINNHIKANVKH